MGFFSDIVRDSQKPPPAVKAAAQGADHPRGGEWTTVLPSDGRPLSLETAGPPLAPMAHEASIPTIGELDAKGKNDAPADTTPLPPPAPPLADPWSVGHTLTTGLDQGNGRENTPPSLGAPSQADPGVTAHHRSNQANTRDKIHSTGTEPAGSEDTLRGVLFSPHPASEEAPERRPAETITRSKTAASPSQFPQNPHPPSAPLMPTPSISTEDADGRVSARPASVANQNHLSSPPEGNPHLNGPQEMPPPGRQRTAASEENLRPTAEGIPMSLVPVSSDAMPEAVGVDDESTWLETLVAAAHPSAPFHSETAAAPPPVQNHGEGRTDRASRQAIRTPNAAPEGPKVRIGLLEVVVQAPETTPKGANRDDKIRANIASRHYLRNL